MYRGEGGSETVFRGGSPREVLPPPAFLPFGVLWKRAFCSNVAIPGSPYRGPPWTI